MGRPSKITADSLNGHQMQRQMQCKVEHACGGSQMSPSMAVKHQNSPSRPSGAWRSMTPYEMTDESLASPHARWSPHDVDGQQRRAHLSESWSSSGIGSEFASDGVLLGTDDLPSPKRRMSDSYMSSSSASSQYQFSPSGGGGAGSSGTGGSNGSSGTESAGERSRMSSASSGHDGLVVGVSANGLGLGLGSYIVGHADAGMWSNPPSDGSAVAPMYVSGHHLVDAGGIDRQRSQNNIGTAVVGGQQMWQVNVLPAGLGGIQSPFLVDQLCGASLYGAPVASSPFGHQQQQQQMHQQQLAGQMGDMTTVGQNMVKSESSATSASDGGSHIQDLTDQIQHIMNESSAMIVNCERSLNFPTSTLRMASSIGDLGLAMRNQSELHHGNNAGMQMNVIGEIIATTRGHHLYADTSYRDSTSSVLDVPNDHKPGTGMTSAFDSVVGDVHEYDRLAESDSFAEHLPVDNNSSIGSNNSDWMDQMTEHLVKDNNSTDSGRSFNPCPSRAADQQQSTAPAGNFSTGDPELDDQVKASMNYWLQPELPDENVMLASRHWAVLNKIMPAYCRFVQLGNNINKGLKAKYDVSC
jgi:hypothetical protein